MTEKPQDKKLAAYRRGFLAEYVAALFLLLKGYHIAAMRYRTKGGEVDIVARRGDLVVFVEVKARADLRSGVDAVGFESQRRIRAASGQWLAKQRDFARLSWRYDIIVISPFRLPLQISDAF
ncbi:putative endonuclease [Ensifer adhaerens]|nr:putative endonuclease [Ensifer adhaerens]